jgi:hypothetical protein
MILHDGALFRNPDAFPQKMVGVVFVMENIGEDDDIKSAVWPGDARSIISVYFDEFTVAPHSL